MLLPLASLQAHRFSTLRTHYLLAIFLFNSIMSSGKNIQSTVNCIEQARLHCIEFRFTYKHFRNIIDAEKNYCEISILKPTLHVWEREKQTVMNFMLSTKKPSQAASNYAYFTSQLETRKWLSEQLKRYYFCAFQSTGLCHFEYHGMNTDEYKICKCSTEAHEISPFCLVA